MIVVEYLRAPKSTVTLTISCQVQVFFLASNHEGRSPNAQHIALEEAIGSLLIWDLKNSELGREEKASEGCKFQSQRVLKRNIGQTLVVLRF